MSDAGPERSRPSAARRRQAARRDHQPDRRVHARALRTRTDQSQDLRARQPDRLRALRRGFTAIERTMMEGGEPDRVLEMRRDFQRMMKERYSEMIEALTGRKVLAFLSQAHVEPDLTIEIFLMDGPLAGFGALELVDPPPSNPATDDD